jgi:hypothetical protein
MPQTAGELTSAPSTPKDYHAPEIRDYGTLRELTNFSETENGTLDYGDPLYATQGYSS